MNERTDFSKPPPFFTGRDLLALYLLPALLLGVLAWLRWVRILLNRRPDGAEITPRLRLFLAGWAVGMVLWLATYWVTDWQERKCGERDRLIIPRLSAIGFSPIEARIVELHVQNIEKVLALPDR